MSETDNETTGPEKLLAPREVAALFGVGSSAVQKWARDGRFTVIRTPGGHTRFRASEIQAAIDERTQEAAK